MPIIQSATGGGLPGGLPTVGRAASGRFVALSDDVKRRMREAAADAINEWTDDVAALSLIEVPKGSRHREGEPDLELASSIRFPGNDPTMAATADDLDAYISYDTVYAGAQHEGEAYMHRYTEAGEIEIHWVVEKYTEPGAKSHYLEDPYKAMIPSLEGRVAAKVAEVTQG
jgi:hypothetical protein